MYRHLFAAAFAVLLPAVVSAQDTCMEEGPNGACFNLLYEQRDLPDEVLFTGYRLANCGDPTRALSEIGAMYNRDSTGRTTYLVPCQIGKANVSYYVVVHHPERGIHYEPMDFELPPGHNKPNRIVVLNPFWDANIDVLEVTRFGNINRNCGAREIHHWLPDAKRFELQYYYSKTSCGGPQTQPQDFPLEWSIDEIGG